MHIRRVEIAELAQLPSIENSAGEAFRGSSQSEVADGPDNPSDFYLPLAAQGLVWVAASEAGLLGFIGCERFDDALHICELDVRHEHQRKGIGRALIAHAIQAARDLQLPAVTLSTFRDIPWNAPFYSRLGFVEPAVDEPHLRRASIAALEAAQGLDVASRCFMRLALPAQSQPATTPP